MATFALAKLLRRPDQIRRRPVRKLQHRHPRPRPPLQGTHRRQARRHHHRVRDRRSHRHRPLFDVSAHQRHRSQPGRQPGRRAIHARKTTAPGPASCSRTRMSSASTAPSVIRWRASITEGLVDLAAMKIGMDPVEIRRRNLIADDAYPCASPSGLRFELLSHHASLRQAAGDDGLRRLARRTGKAARQRISIAASALRLSSKSPIPAPPSTASAAPASRRRTASRCGSMRQAR